MARQYYFDKTLTAATVTIDTATFAYIYMIDQKDTVTLVGRYSAILEAGDGDDYILNNAGDYIEGGGFYIIGGWGNDTLIGSDDNYGQEVLEGGMGNDVLSGRGGYDTIYGGEGQDQLWGGGDSDELFGDNGNDEINGEDGYDNLYGGGGNDTLRGGAGIDYMWGGSGGDHYEVTEDLDKIFEFEGEGRDAVYSFINWTLGASLEDLVLSGTNSTSGTGNSLANVITGNIGANALVGGAGSDQLWGVDGADKLNGGTGADYMNGASGADTYYVDDAGDDVVDTSSSSDIDQVISSVTFNLSDANAVVGQVEKLSLTGAKPINATGNAFNNTLVGNTLANTISGLAGNDAISGGTGNDFIIGGAGKDTMTGGLNADRFDFNISTESGVGTALRDVVTDFNRSQSDRIDLSTIDAKSTLITKLQGANDAFTFLTKEGAAFTKNAGQLHFDQQLVGTAKVTLVEGDINGDGKADFSIQLTGHIAMLATDFYL